MRACVLVAALAVVACAGPAAEPERPLSGLPDQEGPLDALNRRHGRLRQRMETRGYGERIAITRAFVLEDRGIAFPLDLRTDACSTVVALGGGTIRQLELTLYDGDGKEAAIDSVEQEGGLLHVCPQAEPGLTLRPYYLEVRSIEGEGAVMLAHFRSEPGHGEGFDGLFEGVLAPRVPFRDVEEHLARSRSTLRARGFSAVGDPTLARVSEGSVVRAAVGLAEGHCYVVVGRSGQGVGDIDLFLLDAAGVEVARDLGADAEPSIEHCPRSSARYTVELRAFEGAGAVGIMVMGAPRPDAEPTEQPGVDEPASEAGDPSLALGVLAAPLMSRGFSAPIYVARDAAMVPGEVRTHEVVVGPGCALIAGTAADDGMDLDLYLADASGREIDRDTAVHSTARVRACRPQADVLRVAVKAYGRDGTYALAVLRAPTSVDTMQELRLEEASAPYRARQLEARTRWEASLDTGERFTRPVEVPQGGCVAVAVAGDEGAVDVDLFLRGPDGALVSSETGPAPHAAVSRCAEDGSEQLTVEALMYRGSGRVVVLVMRTSGSEEPATTPPAGAVVPAGTRTVAPRTGGAPPAPADSDADDVSGETAH
ncbi:MAG: hypothetical protein AB7S26_19465 [Sandaracinaceae bacterium]